MNAAQLSLLALGFGLAFVNGANDVSKGIATLVGSGVTDYRRAILWGTCWTAVGGLLGVVVARAMVSAFGHGFFAPGTTITLPATIATLSGAAAWVLLATRTGLPVSTTHAIVGSLLGVGTTAYGLRAVRWAALGGKVALPLLLSPVVALVAVPLVLWIARYVAAIAGSGARADEAGADCLCADLEVPALVASDAASASAVFGTPGVRVRLFAGARCAPAPTRVLRFTLDRLHWLTSGATSLARGLNDAPKIAALVLAAVALGGRETLQLPVVFALVTLGMAAGSATAGLRVTRVLAEDVTPMDHREAFAANLVTAALVSVGANLGLPMSTTHVSSGGIVGVGSRRGSLNFRTLRQIVAAWLVTLPGAAVLGVAAYAIVKGLLS